MLLPARYAVICRMLLTLFIGLSLAVDTSAATSSLTTNVRRVLVDDSNYGGCMAQFTDNPRSTLTDCGNEWLTFDCFSAFPGNSKSAAQNKLSQAQLALVTGRKVYVKFTDTRKANGYCFAQRIDVQ